MSECASASQRALAPVTSADLFWAFSCLILCLLSFYLSLFFRKSDSCSRNRRVISGRFLTFRRR